MRWCSFAAAVCAACLLLQFPAPCKEPAKFQLGGAVSGGKVSQGMVLSGVRFGQHTGFIRMVLDLEMEDGAFAAAHPVYHVAAENYPYRLIIRFNGVSFNESARIQAKPALPFSVVTELDGTIREMQVFLPGPSEFKVIEIDDPAKLSIDVREVDLDVPDVFAVQLSGPANAQEAFAITDKADFPAGYEPSVLVLGSAVVIEQTFLEMGTAVAMQSALEEMGYASVINERRGNQLPLSQ